MNRFGYAACVLLLSSLGVWAQSNQGTITGTISDPAGAVVPGATIEVKNVETGVIYRGGTSATGNYVIVVPVGTYEITVNVPGFKKFVQQNVPVVVATDTRKDITLEVGTANEVVTVADTAPLLKTESGEMSHQVTTADADNLPVLTIAGGGFTGATTMGNIRNPLQSSLLLPGVTFSNDQDLVVNGLPSNSETIRIEGQDSTGTLWKVYQQRSQAAGVDAIQEVSVQTSNFAAEYGQVGGGYFNFTMKSGTNQLHGSGYDYLVNEALNAGLPFTDAGTTNSLKEGQHIRNAQRRNDFGGTIGGPIRIPKIYNGTNRSFFFFNFEQYREKQLVANGITTVPTAAYRNGDFSNAGCFNFNAATNSCNGAPTALTQGGKPAVDTAGQTLTYGEVFDPTTTHTVNGAQVRNPFPNNTIPLSRYDPVALAIQKMLPMPNAPGLINNYNIPGYINWEHTTTISWKIDHSISPTAKLAWYFSHYSWNSPNANGFVGPYSTEVPTGYRNWTTRLNYDDTLKPTLLFHAGIGFFHQYEPTVPPAFDESTIGMHGYFNENLFPTIGGLSNANTGGWNALGGALGGSFEAFIWEEKPTANTSLTWVHGNHIYKFGGEYTGEGYPEHSAWRTNGNFTFSNAETSDPWQNGQALNIANGTGFAYASFLLGLPDSMSISPYTQTKLGNHLMGFYAQDSWKVTRRFTLDYGLRYDFQTYLKEEHGRMQDASFVTPNPTVGGLLGAGIYEGYGGGRCNCELSHNYPYAFGPRLGAAYQINSKTVLRAGAGVSYGLVQTPAGTSYSTADYYQVNATGYGVTPVPGGLAGGNPYPNVTWPSFTPGKYPVPSGGLLPPGNPFIYYAPEARPPRILQWSFGIQRELQKDIVVEATYVGNREVWGAAPYADQMAANAISNATLAHYGLSLSNPADLALLNSLISSPAAAAAGFFPAYAGMPGNQTVAQQIRPVPQWTTIPFVALGPPIGKTWYDSLQTKVTKRISHGLQVQGSFVWAKALVNGTGAETGQFVTGIPLYNDIFNYGLNKQLNQLVRPEAVVVSGTYTTPKFAADTKGMKLLSVITRDWQLGWVLRYQNGALIPVPRSNNQIQNELKRNDATFENYVPGVNPLKVDPNCGCFNPQTTFVLNPAAWTDAPAGTFGVSAPFYNNYRWQRQPAESMSFGRNFRMGKEGRYNLYVRAEFLNIFNRLFLSMPSPSTSAGVGGLPVVNPASAPAISNGVITGGFGAVATIGGAGDTPRSGQIVARFTF
ncbi:MAG TPA: TonB-dependent receptor [Bryobacteraceae bacterium]|nr:TonB-dependent receptor [Bryobacteraceae bacterium]